MISMLALATAVTIPAETRTILPCDGVRVIEAATVDRPLPFATLRKQDQVLATVRDAQGQRVQRMVPVTNVKPINGFKRCRFVYTSQIDLACYVGGTYDRNQADVVAATLASTADALGQCLTNQNLARAGEEAGSSPVVTYSGGARQPFWQVSMVALEDDPGQVEAEILVLGPSHLAAPAPPPLRGRTAPKAKRKRG
jgi:hypothetical protein